MKQHGRAIVLAAPLALLLALGGCGERIDTADANGNPTNPAMKGPAATGDVAPGTAEAPRAPETGAMGASGEVGLTDDVRIVANVNLALSADPDLGALKIEVESRDGVVTLRGTAPDPAAKERAAAIARNVDNVKSVDNQLSLA